MGYIFKTLLSNAANYGAARTAGAINYIVIHYTANTADTAQNNAQYFKENKPGTSAHYFVDDKYIYQSVPVLRKANAVGGSRYTDYKTTGGASMYGKVKNMNSISIELCSQNGKITEATMENAAALVRKLMSKYNIPAKNVCRHFDVTGKHCPGWTGWWGKNDTKWQAFKALLTGGEEKPPVAKPVIKKGVKGTQAGYLQRDLNYLGIKDDENKILEVDGSCGPKTVQAIKKYQKKYGLKVDGSYGPASAAVMENLLI